ncbi:hypothetical protein FAI40_03945 [Acetobacteraceae bacterium]|nr:hypothetical protein FAI40_03945 [Acetobacteraceae bacterium]
MKDYQNPNIMDDDLLEEAKALLKDMLVLIRQAKSKEIIDLYSKFASKLSAMRCTIFGELTHS